MQRAAGMDVPYIVHFEYDFDKTDLARTVKTEIDAFKAALRPWPRGGRG